MSLAELLRTVPDDCECTWTGNFEGEALGMVYTITERARRCPRHGHKPRHKTEHETEEL